MARLDLAVDEARRARQIEGRLGDVVARIRNDALTELLALLGGAVRSDEHVVAARLADRFHHQLVEVGQDVLARLVVG